DPAGGRTGRGAGGAADRAADAGRDRIRSPRSCCRAGQAGAAGRPSGRASALGRARAGAGPSRDAGAPGGARARVAAHARHVQAGAKLDARLTALFSDDRERRAVGARMSVALGLAEAAEALPDVDGARLAAELGWGLRRYLEAAASETPVVVVVDDVQWAEPA